MDYSFGFLLLLGMAGVAMSALVMLEGKKQSCEIGQPCVLQCTWEHASESTVQISGWKAEGKGIVKNTRNNSDGTFIYENSPIDASKLSESTDWIGDEGPNGNTLQTSTLTIDNFSVLDPENYTCEVDIGRQQASTKVQASAYAEPSVSVEDGAVEADLRTPIAVPTEAPTNVINGTDETTEPDIESSEALPEDAGADDSSDTGSFSRKKRQSDASGEEKYLEVSCLIEDAYPQPSRVEFVVGENEPFAPTSPVEWTQDPDTKLYSARALLRLKADPKYDNKAASCSAWLPTKPTSLEFRSSNTSSTFVIYHETTIVSTSISPDVVKEGETAVIECRGDGNPRPIFNIKSEGEAIFEEGGSRDKFPIDSVSRFHAGIYYCVAVLEDRRDPGATTYVESSNKPTLQVYYNDDPEVDSPSDVNTRKGASLDITCTGSGEPTPRVSWKKNGNNIGSSGRLFIPKLEYSDSGSYECVSDNAAETTTKSVKVQVQGACEIDFKDPYIASSTTAGAYLVRLECITTGKPDCEVDIVQPTDFEVEGTTKAIAHGSILEFEAMPKLSRPVAFACVAKNFLTPANFNKTVRIEDGTEVCCEGPKASGIGTGAIVGIILLVLVVVIGIPLACYFVRKKNAGPGSKKAPDAEAAEPEKEGLNKEASSEDSDTGSLPPPPADMDDDRRFNSAHEMKTFSSNK